MNEYIDKALDFAFVALWGISGGIAHLFISGKRPTFYAFLYCIFVSGFAGMMVGRLMEASDLPQYLREFAIGMGGFGGPATLNILYRKMGKTFLGVSDKDIDKAMEETKKQPTHTDGRNKY